MALKKKLKQDVNEITTAAMAEDFEPNAFVEMLRRRYPHARPQELSMIFDLSNAYRLCKIDVEENGIFVPANNGTGKFSSPAIKLQIELAKCITRLVADLSAQHAKHEERVTNKRSEAAVSFLRGWQPFPDHQEPDDGGKLN